MPLSPRRQAELRAEKKKLEEPKKLGPRKRCDNCDKRFHKNRKDQRFCCGNCRKEFFANGGNAFGPLKVRLEKLVKQLIGPLETRINQLDGRIGVDECLLQNVRNAVADAQRTATLAQSPSQPSPATEAKPVRHSRG
jgi:ribosomal protein L37AE/L43A